MIGLTRRKRAIKIATPSSAGLYAKKAVAHLIIALEPRIMFDAAAVATADALLDANHDASASTEPAKATADVHENHGDQVSSLLPASSSSSPDGQSPTAAGVEIAFVDPRLQDSKTLITGIKPGVQVVLLDPTKDGIAQITEALSKAGNVSAIHILSHGTPGNLFIGSTDLTGDILVARSAELAAWKSNLTEQADILIYGCDVAQGSIGSGLITSLARITSADVTASTDATGAVRLGGNWVLENTTGPIEAKSPLTSAAMAGYDALMAAPVNTVPVAQTVAEDNTLTFSSGNSNAISVSDADGGSLTVTLTSTNGALTLGGTTGLAFTSGDGTTDSSMTFSGAIANINTALNGLQFVPVTNYSGAASVQIDAYDGTTHDTDTVNVTVNPNATAPVLTLPATSQIVAEDTASYLNFTGSNAIVLTDADVNDQQMLTLSVAHGTLVVKTDVGGGVTNAGGNGTASVILSGTAAQLSATLAHAQGLQYTSVLNYNSSAAAGVETLSFNLNDGVHTQTGSVALNVTPVNDAPIFTGAVAATVLEGASVGFSRAQLASSDNALDVDIQTGQQVINQLMVKIDSLPAGGALSYKSGAVVVGSVVPVTDLGNLVYTHNGDDVGSDQTFNFNVTVSDGGGGATAGIISVTVQPKNVAPVISGSPSLIEGQVKVVAPAINLGDSFDTLDNSTIVIDNIVSGGQGTLFIDANNNNVVDTGEALSGSTTLDATQRANLSTQLKFFQNGYEPNTPAAVSPSYRVTVTDAGGGAGVPSAPIAQTITLSISPNNDDPTLVNTHPTVGSALAAQEGNITTITVAMLQILDADLDPANTAKNTPEYQLVYTIGARPTQGEIQVNIGGGVGYNSDGWITLGDGGRFTQAQVAAGKVRYYQTVNVPDAPAITNDSFTFTVRDSAYGYDVWTDPANPTTPREGGLRATPTGDIATQQFYFDITPLAAPATPRVNPYEGGPRNATPGYGGENMTYTFAPTAGMLSNNSTAGGSWDEANVLTGGAGNVITKEMLSYTITRTDNMGTPATGDDVSVTVPADETVYTLTVQAPNGKVQSNAGGSWQDIPTNGQFTQADINAGNIRFVHDGSENHTSTFGYAVSDGTPNHYHDTFGLNITPTNDRPTGSGGTVQVLEKLLPGNDGLVRLDSSALGMSDVDLSQDAAKRTGEGAADFLWFTIVAQPKDGGATQRGELQRWDGDSWETITPGQWLPSTLLTMTADGATSGLRYAHDGSEPLAYTGSPNVTFQYQVRDDLPAPVGDPALAASAVVVANTSGSAQSNQSANATTTIKIIPVNNAPIIADKPGDTAPTIGSTIASGGALTGVNQILVNVPEGGVATITSAYLTAIDPDNTTVQRQYQLKSMPTQGVLLLSGKVLGVGSTFTQDDIDNNRVTYRHSGGEITAPTTDALGGPYHDKFHFALSDAVSDDTGTGSPNYNTFLIALTPTNDAPTLTGPTGIIEIDSATAANNLVSGFVIADPDLTDGVQSGETDFVQATVRLLDSAGTAVTDYTTGFAGGGVSIGYTTPGDITGLWSVTQNGINNILQIQGTRAQVNAALAGLSVTFANDANSMYKVQVIADDRMRNISGTLDTSGYDANGGELNQATSAGGTPTAVPATVYDWATAVAAPAADGNIAATSVDIRASRVNELPTLTGPGAQTVYEDVRTQIPASSFNIADPESAAFNTPITVTLSVPSGHGTLGIGAAGAETSLTPSGGQAVAIAGDNTLTITLTGRAADIKALLNARNYADTADDANGGLYYTSPANGNHDYNGAGEGDVTLTVSLNDAGSRFGSDIGAGSVANNPADITIPITITPVNDAPGVTAPGTAVAVNSTGAIAIAGFSISDTDDTDGGGLATTTGETDFVQTTVRLLDSSGNPITDYTGVVFGIAGGATTDVTWTGIGKPIVLRGTLSQVNTALAGLSVTMDGDRNATYKLQVLADDRLRNASGALIGGADGGAVNQQEGLPAVPAGDAFYGDPVNTTTATATSLFNIVAGTVNLNVSSSNNPPINTMPAAITVTEDSTNNAVKNGVQYIQVGDTDDFGANLTVVLTATGGVMSIGDNAGVTGDNASGQTSLTLVGGKTNLNAVLQSLTFSPTSNLHGASGVANIRVATTDTALAGSGGNLTDTDDLNIAIAAVNDQPMTSSNVTLGAVTEDTTPAGDAINGLAFGYSDATDDQTGVTNGTTAIVGGDSSTTFSYIAIVGDTNYVAAQGSWQVSNESGGWITIPDSGLSATAALIFPSSRNIRFVPAANYHGTPGTLNVRLADASVDLSGKISPDSSTKFDLSQVANGGASTTGAWSSVDRTIGTTVTNVNDRPTLSATTLIATTEDHTGPAGATVSALGFGYSDTTDNQTGITGGGNAATSFGGIAIVGNAADSATQGVWQYNNGGGWVTIAGAGAAPADATALLLPTSASLRFLPNVPNYNGTPGTLTVRVSDTAVAFNANSDISATLVNQTSNWSTMQTLTTTVNPVNDAPTIVGTSAADPTVTENVTMASGVSIDPTNLLTGAATLTDLDLTTTAVLTAGRFGAGTITVTVTDGIAGDVVFVNGGALDGISSTTGGTGSTPLIITLNNTATITDVQNILAALQYKSASDNPTVNNTDLTRSYTIVVNDGNNVQTGGNAGGPGALAAATINGTITINSLNDPPVVDLNGGVEGQDNTVTWTEGANVAHVAVNIAAGGTIADVDNTNLTQMVMVVGGLRDGNNEVLNIGGTAFQLGTNATNVDIGSYLVSYVAATGTFTIVPDGSTFAALTNYQALLQGISYINNTDNPTSGSRSFNVQVTDAGIDNAGTGGANNLLSGNNPTSTLTVTPANDQPRLTNLNAVSFHENLIQATPDWLDQSITLADIDSPGYAGGTITISGLVTADIVSLPSAPAASSGNVQWTGVNGGDVQYHDGSSWITVGTATGGTASNFVVTLNGSATAAIAQRVIENLTFKNTSDAPTTSRTLTYAVNDSSPVGSVLGATLGVTIVRDNDAPVLGNSITGTTYVENAAPTILTTTGTVSDPDSPANFNGGELRAALAAYQTGDVLQISTNGTVTLGGGNTVLVSGTSIGTYSGGNGADFVIALNSNATAASIQTVLQRLAYSSTSDDPTVNTTALSRAVTITLNDGGNTKDATSTTTALTATMSGTINITATADAPVITPAGAAAAYTENAAATTVDNTVTLTDPDDTQVTGGTISITGGFLAGDLLAITNTGAITGSYAAGTGILTLTGTDTLANYQTVLRSLTYRNSTDDPTNNDTVANRTRTLTYSLTDANSDGAGEATGTAAKTINITATTDNPVMSAGGTLAYTENQAAQVIDSTVAVVSDADDTQMASATVQLTVGLTTGDVLAVSGTAIGGTIAGTNITVTSYDSGTGLLTLTGADTLAKYQTALRTVTFNSTSDDPTATSASRTVTWRTTDANSDNVGAGTSVAVTSTINITAVNDAPVAVADTGTTQENVTLTVAAGSGVLANDTDLDTTDTHTVSAVNGVVANVGAGVAGANGGTFIIAANGSYVFNPGTAFDYLAVGESQTTSVTYTNLDSNGLSASTTLTITVTGANDAPTAVADTGTTPENATLTVAAGSGVLANDTDLDTTDTHTVSAVNGVVANVGAGVAGANGGTFIIAADGSYTFNPGTAFNDLFVGESRTTSVNYTNLDSNGFSASTTLTITVTGINAVPPPPPPPPEPPPPPPPPPANTPPPADGPTPPPANDHYDGGLSDLLRLDGGVTSGLVTFGSGTDSTTGEHSLYLVKMPSSQEVITEQTSTFNLPSGMFKHSDSDAKVTVEATLADGRPLPDWLKFDPASGRFAVTPPEGTGGAMDIKITARDQHGNVVTSQFLLHITESESEKPVGGGTDSSDNSDPNPGERPLNARGDLLKEQEIFYSSSPPLFRGRPSLAEQMVSLGHRKTEGDVLRALQSTFLLKRKAA